MRNATRLLLIAVLMLTAAAAGAQEMPSKTLFQANSADGESKIDFLQRVGAQMRQWSDGTGFEACAAIGTDGSRFGVVVTTNGSHLACASRHGNVPAGMHSTNETIHTHGTNKRFKANRADAKMADPRLRIGMNNPVSGQNLDVFSLADYAEPGYLAAPNGVLLYQSGDGTQRIAAGGTSSATP